MALIRLRVCAGWSEPLLVAHTTLLEISCHGSIRKKVPTCYNYVDIKKLLTFKILNSTQGMVIGKAELVQSVYILSVIKSYILNIQLAKIFPRFH